MKIMRIKLTADGMLKYKYARDSYQFTPEQEYEREYTGTGRRRKLTLTNEELDQLVGWG